MTNGQEWIGKKLSDKDNPKITHTVVDNQNGTLILNNNARIQENRVSEVFNEVNNTIDPDAFFNTGASILASTITNNSQNSYSIGVSEPMQNINQPYASGISEDTMRHFSEHKKNPILPINNYGLVEDEFGNSINSDDNRMNNNYIQPHNVNSSNSTLNIPMQQPQQSASENIFKNMRRTTSIKLKLELDEKIPSKESIKHFNDMFDENESVIDKLAKEITNKFLSNPKTLQDLVADQLEILIIGRKKTKKKPVKKKRVVKPVVKAIKNDTSSNEEHI